MVLYASYLEKKKKLKKKWTLYLKNLDKRHKMDPKIEN